MKTFRIFVVMMAICMLMTGCGKHTNPSTSANPSNPAAIADTNTTQNPTSQDVNGTTEAPSQGSTNSGDYVSSDSRITPVRLEDYWISDTQFDFINYCRDQGATVKYMLVDDNDGSVSYCLPEDLSSTSGKTVLAIGGYFNFGGDPEYVSVYCQFGGSDMYYVSGDSFRMAQYIGTSFSGDTDTIITIDNYGHTLSLSTINHLPVVFEYVMTLSYYSTEQDMRDTFSTHYHDNE